MMFQVNDLHVYVPTRLDLLADQFAGIMQLLNEPALDKTYNKICVTSEDSSSTSSRLSKEGCMRTLATLGGCTGLSESLLVFL